MAYLSVTAEDAEDFAPFVRQRHLVADRDGHVLIAGERDGERPEEPVLQVHVEAGAPPVGRAHEARKRRVGAHAEHEEVRTLAAGERQLLEPARPASALRPARLRAAAGAARRRSHVGRSGPTRDVPVVGSAGETVIPARNPG